MNTILIVFLIFFAFIDGGHISMAAAPDYPTKPVEIIVGMAAGGGTDLTTRMLAENAKKYLGQEFVIENKPGANNRIAMTSVYRAKPDGYTLGAASHSFIVLTPLVEKVPYKPEDFTFISRFGSQAYGWVVREDSPLHSVKDLIEFARANPNKLTAATLGRGSFSHMSIEAFANVEGLKIKLVPFPGNAEAIPALLGRHVMVHSCSASGFAENLRAKKVRLLAIANEEKSEDYPGVPILRELGYPFLIFENWHIVVGPKGMEKSIVNKLGEAFKKAQDAPSFVNVNEKLHISVKNPLAGDEVLEGVMKRIKTSEELVKKCGMEIKQ